MALKRELEQARRAHQAEQRELTKAGRAARENLREELKAHGQQKRAELAGELERSRKDLRKDYKAEVARIRKAHAKPRKRAAKKADRKGWFAWQVGQAARSTRVSKKETLAFAGNTSSLRDAEKRASDFSRQRNTFGRVIENGEVLVRFYQGKRYT